MLKWIACWIWITMSWSAFSQTTLYPQEPKLTLAPLVRVVETDTLLCFSLDQSRVLASELIRSQFADSTQVAFEAAVSSFEEVVALQDARISLLSTQIDHLKEVDQNHLQATFHLENTIALQEKKIRRSRWQRWLLAGGLVVTSSLLLLQ